MFEADQTTKGIELGLAAENDKRKASVQREQIYTQAQTQRENASRRQTKPTKGE